MVGGLAVAGDGDLGERRGGGELGQGRAAGRPSPGAGRACRCGPAAGRTGRRPCAAGWSRSRGAAASSARRRRRRSRRPRGCARPGSAPASMLGHAAGQPQPRGGDGALDDQLGQHRDGHGPADRPAAATTIAATTQLFPYPVFAGPGAEPSWNHDAAHTFLPRRRNKRVVDRHGHRLPGRAPAAPPPAGRRPGPAHRGSSGRGRRTSAPGHAARAGDRPAPASIPHTVRLPGLREEPAGQAAERAERRGGEQRREDGQQRSSATREPVAWHPGASAGTRFIERFRQAPPMLSFSTPVPAASD